MKDTIFNGDIKAVVKRIPASIRSKYIDLIAALVILKWIHSRDAAEEESALRRGSAYQPMLPGALRGQFWSEPDITKWREVLRTNLDDAVANGLALDLASPSPQFHRLTQDLLLVRPVLRDVAELSDDQASTLRLLISRAPFAGGKPDRELQSFLAWVRAASLRSIGDPSGEFSEHTSNGLIAALVSEIASPQPGESIYDPCFGLAGLLVAVWGKLKLSTSSTDLHDDERRSCQIFGREVNPRAYMIGLATMIAAGMQDPQVAFGDSIVGENAIDLGVTEFDLIVADPPISVHAEPKDSKGYPVQTSSTTGLFIQHVLARLRDGGRAVMVVPSGFLFQRSEQALRKHLIERRHVEAVVGLPPNSYRPRTSVSVSLMVLRKDTHSNMIRMVDTTPLRNELFKRRVTDFEDTFASVVAEAVRSDRASNSTWAVGFNDLESLDWDLTPRRREKGALEEALAALGSVGTIVPLGECCEIQSGRAIPVDLQSNHGVPYIRISDIWSGAVVSARNWIVPEAVENRPEFRLQDGDLLFAKSGTIGKIAVVRDEAVGAVAASGLYVLHPVLRPDSTRVDPDYLLAYLESARCQSWLKSQTRGTVLQFLTAKVLGALPVLVPPLEMQRAIASSCKGGKADVLAEIASTVQGGDKYAMAQWISSALNRLPASTESIEDPLDFDPLMQVLDDINPKALLKSDSDDEGVRKIPLWLEALLEVGRRLENLSYIPLGPTYGLLLSETSSLLSTATALVDGESPTVNAQARQLLGVVADWITAAIDALYAKRHLSVEPVSESLLIGEIIEMPIRIVNDGPIPFTYIRVEAYWDSKEDRPGYTEEAEFYLTEGESVELTLKLHGPFSVGDLRVEVNVVAETIVEKSITVEREFTFKIIANDASIPELADLGPSPYVTGTPVRPDRNDVFFGREELIEQISRQIQKSGNVVLLEGNRRAGKTSILLHLEGLNAVPGWLGVYCSLQDMEGAKDVSGVPTVEVFRGMARRIARALYEQGWEAVLPNGSKLASSGADTNSVARARQLRNGVNEGISSDAPYNDFREYLDSVLALAKSKGFGLFLMLDEFDKLHEGIRNHVTSPQVPENIRQLVQGRSGFTVVLTGSKRLGRLREEYWSALYGLGTRFGVTSLDAKAASRLVTEPVKGKLNFSPGAVDSAVSTTAGQPFLLQCLCNRIFDIASSSHVKTVTTDMVDDACTALVKENEHFANFWDFVGADRRRLILALCQRQSLQATTFGRLTILLAELGVEIEPNMLKDDLDQLRELELLRFVELDGRSTYRLEVPLMGTWIEQHHDLEILVLGARREVEDSRE